MTLRSPKKRPITAPTFSRPIRIDRAAGKLTLAAICFACGTLGDTHTQAQTPPGSFAGPGQAATTSPTARAGWNLRWRKSAQVAPKPVHVPKHDVFAPPPAQPNTLRQPAAIAPVSYEQPVSYDQPQPLRNPVRSANAFQQAAATRSIRQAGHSDRLPPASETLPPAAVSNYRRQPAPGASPAPVAQPNDFFNNPFGGQPRTVSSSSSAARIAQEPGRSSGEIKTRGASQLRIVQSQAGGQDGLQLPSEMPSEMPATDTPLPQDAMPGNMLRSDLNGPAGDLPAEVPPAQNPPADSLRLQLQQAPDPSETRELPAPRPQDASPADDGPSIRDLFNDPDEMLDPQELGVAPQQEIESPSDLEAEMKPERPFEDARVQRERSGNPAQDDLYGMLQMRDTGMINQLSCEDFRERIARATIDTISLDPSPPFRPDLFSEKRYQQQRERFESRQSVRPWTNLDGAVIAEGRLIDLAYEHIVIESDNGTRQEVPVRNLSEGDLGYLSENWGLPKECRIEHVAFAPRSWTPLTMTWKASNICSKPRYYEEVNLERYGHTAGPWLQPVISSAHFFANIAVTPYKMGVHPPNECQYALGYYRPGNCAPWIIPPVPISARGALTQGAVMTGAIWLIP